MPEQPPARSLAAEPDTGVRSDLRAEGNTVLAFDYGERRVGVAVGDAELGTAHPLQAIAVAGDARIAAIEALVHEWHPARLVVGIPLARDGSLSVLARRTQRFARQLEARLRIPVAMVDERYSSVEAESRIRDAAGARRAAASSRARTIDSYAAHLLLEQYFAEAS